MSVSFTRSILILVLSLAGFSLLYVQGSEIQHEHTPSRYEIDPFKKLLVAMNITNGTHIPMDHLEHLVDKVTLRYICEKTTCKNVLCLSAKKLTEIATGLLLPRLSRDEFYKFALVLFYRLQKKDELCKTPPDLSFAEYLSKTVALLTDDQQMISMVKLDETLHKLTGTPHPDDEEKDDHDHDHDDHGPHHKRRRRSTNDQQTEHDDHEHDEIELPPLYKTKCFSAELVIDQSGVEMENKNISKAVKEIAAVVILHLYHGTNLNHSCRILPTETAFLNDLFQSFHAVNGSLTLDGFKDILEKLGIGSSEKHDEDHHDHAHSKRSLNKRFKRAVEQPTMSKGKINECYTYLELLSVFSEHPTSTIGSALFKDICPALLQQYSSGVCKVKQKVKHDISQAESYGYGTLCVVIICLCSVVGALVVVCENQIVFTYIMATFEGLAVGTLTSDAVLHLIPEALGLHKHGDGDHGSEESSSIGYLWFCLACLGGLYMFYLLELMLTSYNGGHGHSHDFTEAKGQETEIYTVTDDSKSVNEKVNSQMNIVDVKTPIKRSTKIPPVAFMIVIGDALHNFADGLAIGAAFNQSLFIGFSTSIAVLCHELPHELGDFVVLLSCRIGLKRAVLFNLLSSLTALIGLYIGLVIATDIAIRQWIFAVTSGMFLYIALVDLLPRLQLTDFRKNECLLLFSNLGILCGVLLMLLIGIYEEDIKFT